ncbi:2OG-Fe(II) oxygenase family protein [Shewanella pneumatophori]|uniref:2OG-Fe(II) oxygenase n=1 Tax=Shewanella pneumatophori TaxID=314092 RepID=A0A9X1ZKM7_9GAMM|nr:2OG-Fe(II) oxygenase family protein [Shewanella pneumatophori]MCL1137646.1 2OG-Fe(II) oxygenase [Shewanella pneumatophori]
MTISFSPNLDWDSLKNQYKKDDRIKISDIWLPEDANKINQCLTSETEFSHAYTQNGRPLVSSDKELRDMTSNAQKSLFQNLYQDASKGVGFWYGRHMVTPSSPRLLNTVKSYLNSDSLLENIRYISDRPDIKLASAQGTRYTPGNFLTRHRDVVEREGRILAFVLGFTPKWHPDWGGLLQFYQDDGTPRDAWTPEFNSMTLFDVKHVHAVTYLTPFCPSQRFSITGWFRSR